MLIITSGLTIYGMGAWAYTFYMVLRDGEVLVREPNTQILLAEFIMATVYTVVGVIGLLFVIITEIKSGRGAE